MTPSLFKSLPFDPVKDFEMVSLIGTFGFALAVGSAPFLAAEVFRSMARIEATIVPYKTSADVVRALRAGDVQAIFETIAPITPHAKAGTMRVLGVTEAQRFPSLPNYEIVG